MSLKKQLNMKIWIINIKSQPNLSHQLHTKKQQQNLNQLSSSLIHSLRLLQKNKQNLKEVSSSLSLSLQLNLRKIKQNSSHNLNPQQNLNQPLNIKNMNLSKP